MARADPRRGRALRVRLEQLENGRLQLARELLDLARVRVRVLTLALTLTLTLTPTLT